jgi:phosphatidylserine synthase
LKGDSWVRDVMPYVIPVVAFLMVSRLPYVHAASWLFHRKSFPALVALIFSAFVIVLWPETFVPLLCLGYMVSGPSVWLARRLRGRRDGPVI